jgi:ABC-type dipeptide/oligopeptide/nickel transport system permease subunit
MISFARNWLPTLSEHWYIVGYPGLAIVLFVLAWNLAGDALRDILPLTRQGNSLNLALPPLSLGSMFAF